jgi:hypothetical protein
MKLHETKLLLIALWCAVRRGAGIIHVPEGMHIPSRGVLTPSNEVREEGKVTCLERPSSESEVKVRSESEKKCE